MSTALVLGGTGQIGRSVVEGLARDGWQVVAVSRKARDARAHPGVRWLDGSLQAMPALPPRLDAILSCGPLDAFAEWMQAATIDVPRVIAFGSTSLDTKSESIDAAERELAARLHIAESRLQARAATGGIGLTLLRPTLVYGHGMDRSLSRIVAIARRFGRFALPADAVGLRQPVHAADLASAALACLSAPTSIGRTYALPGGEALPYFDMVARVLALLDPAPRLHRLPSPLFSAVAGLAKAAGQLEGFNEAMRARMRADMVFDPAPAHADFGYAPRRFDVFPGMFGSAG